MTINQAKQIMDYWYKTSSMMSASAAEGGFLPTRIKTAEVIEAEIVLREEQKRIDSEELKQAFFTQRRLAKKRAKQERKRKEMLSSEKKHIKRKFQSYTSVMLRMILLIDSESNLEDHDKEKLKENFRELSDFFTAKLKDIKK